VSLPSTSAQLMSLVVSPYRREQRRGLAGGRTVPLTDHVATAVVHYPCIKHRANTGTGGTEGQRADK
jgi:hypothetical protein